MYQTFQNGLQNIHFYPENSEKHRYRNRENDVPATQTFDLENESAPPDWKNRTAQISMGAFKVTIKNTDNNEECAVTKRQISSSKQETKQETKHETKQTVKKEPLQLKSTGPIRKLPKFKENVLFEIWSSFFGNFEK